MEVKINETIVQPEMIIISGSRRDETRLPVVEPGPIPVPIPVPISVPIPVLTRRKGGDDWFVLFSGVREKPVVIPLGKNNCFRSPNWNIFHVLYLRLDLTAGCNLLTQLFSLSLMQQPPQQQHRCQQLSTKSIRCVWTSKQLKRSCQQNRTVSPLSRRGGSRRCRRNPSQLSESWMMIGSVC